MRIKPNPLRYAAHVAGTACHLAHSTARIGLTSALGDYETTLAICSSITGPGRRFACRPCSVHGNRRLYPWQLRSKVWMLRERAARCFNNRPYAGLLVLRKLASLSYFSHYSVLPSWVAPLLARCRACSLARRIGCFNGAFFARRLGHKHDGGMGGNFWRRGSGRPLCSASLVA